MPKIGDKLFKNCIAALLPSYRAKKGFTLVEVLIAISIIAIVFGVVIRSSNAISQRARDTQRKADLSDIQTALQQYYADQNFFPDDDNTAGGQPFNLSNLATANTPFQNTIGNPNPPTGTTKTYLNTFPKDPVTNSGSPYCYKAYTASSDLSTNCDNLSTSSTTCQYYKLFTNLETLNPESPDVSKTCGAFTTYNYILTPL